MEAGSQFVPGDWSTSKPLEFASSDTRASSQVFTCIQRALSLERGALSPPGFLRPQAWSSGWKEENLGRARWFLFVCSFFLFIHFLCYSKPLRLWLQICWVVGPGEVIYNRVLTQWKDGHLMLSTRKKKEQGAGEFLKVLSWNGWGRENIRRWLRWNYCHGDQQVCHERKRNYLEKCFLFFGDRGPFGESGTNYGFSAYPEVYTRIREDQRLFDDPPHKFQQSGGPGWCSH